MFKDKASRMQQVADILQDAKLRMYKEECQKAAENGDRPTMSRTKGVDIPISWFLKELRNLQPKNTEQIRQISDFW